MPPRPNRNSVYHQNKN